MIACKSIGDCKFIVLVVRSSIPLTHTIINDDLHVDVVHGDDKSCQPSLMLVPFVVCGNDGAHIFYSGECDDGLCTSSAARLDHCAIDQYTLIQKCGMIIASHNECVKVLYDATCCHGNICGTFPSHLCEKNWILDETCGVKSCTPYVWDIVFWGKGCCKGIISGNYILPM